MSIFKGATEPKKIIYGDSITVSDMQGPCPDGFHIPLITERQAVYNIWKALGGGSSAGTNFGIALKLPFAGGREDSTSNVRLQGQYGYYRSSSPYDDRFASSLLFYGSSISFPTGFYRTNGMSIRCFRDSPIVPTSSWTKLYGTSIEAGGIFWSSTDGLISLSSDGQTWITMTDKNLGASTVWNSGDTLSETNCGKYYQWGNNYGFPRTGSVTKSGTQVNASTYGPGNYYDSSTYIAYNGRWDTTDNRNLRGGTSQGTWEKAIEIKAVYLGITQVRPSIQPVNETFSYTGSDQTWTVPYTQDYIITCKGAGSRGAKGGFAQGTLTLTAGDTLSIMVGANGGSGNGTKYGFGGSANGGSNAAGGGLSGVFTGSATITASDSSRALVIGGGAGGNSAGTGGAGGGTTGGTGTGSYGTAGAGGTQTGRGSGGNAGASQFNGGNGSGKYGYGGGGGWQGGNGSIGDSSSDDDKGGGGGSGYVISTASNRTLTQGGGAAAGNNGEVTIVSVNQ